MAFLKVNSDNLHYQIGCYFNFLREVRDYRVCMRLALSVMCSSKFCVLRFRYT